MSRRLWFPLEVMQNAELVWAVHQPRSAETWMMARCSCLLPTAYAHEVLHCLILSLPTARSLLHSVICRHWFGRFKHLTLKILQIRWGVALLRHQSQCSCGIAAGVGPGNLIAVAEWNMLLLLVTYRDFSKAFIPCLSNIMSGKKSLLEILFAAIHYIFSCKVSQGMLCLLCMLRVVLQVLLRVAPDPL